MSIEGPIFPKELEYAFLGEQVGYVLNGIDFYQARRIPIMKKAVRFFQQALCGAETVRTLRLDYHSVENLKTYRDAIAVYDEMARQNHRLAERPPQEAFQQIASTLEKLCATEEKSEIPQEELEDVKHFFATLEKLAMEKITSKNVTDRVHILEL